MISLPDIRPGDRILMLVIPDLSLISAVARRLEQGLLVGIGSSEQVSAARRACADLDNVMFVPADPDGVIPWQNGFFTLVLVPASRQDDSEVARVLAPDGRISTIPD